jgi:hypothetical protein
MEIPFRTLTIKKTAATVIIELVINTTTSCFDEIGIHNVVEQLYANTYQSFIIRLKSFEMGEIFEIHNNSPRSLSETLKELNVLMEANYRFQRFAEDHNLILNTI